MKPEAFFFLLTLLVTWLGWRGIRRVQKAYGAVLDNLAALRSGDEEAPRHPVVAKVVQDYEDALLRRDTQATADVLVERALAGLQAPGGRATVGFWVRFVRSAISVCLILGLLGTFFGLAIALGRLTGALSQAAVQSGTSADMVLLLQQLRGLLSGMSTVFYASIFGVAGSLVLTLLSTAYGTFTIGDRVATELEHYLCNEYLPKAPVSAGENVQRRLLDRLDEVATSLAAGLSGGLAEAAERFSTAAQSVGEVLQQVKPITASLGASSEGIAALGQGMSTVTEEMRSVITALKVSQETVPQRLEALRQVEQELVSVLGRVAESVAGDQEREKKLIDAIDLFHSSAGHIDSTLAEFRKQWPVIVEAFSSRAERAIELQITGVGDAVQALRESIEQGQHDTLERMEALVTAHTATAQAVAEALLDGHRRG